MFGSRYLLAFAALVVLTAGCGGGGNGGESFGAKSIAEELFIGDGNHSVRLSWNEPRAREDGSLIGPELAYRVHVQSGNVAIQSVPVGSTNNVLLRGLDSSSYEFSVSSVDSGGIESGPSEPVAVSIP